MATQLGDQFLYQSSLKSDPDIKVSSRKRVPYVIDINQSSYTNGVVTLDASAQLNGAEGFGSLRDAYLIIPFKVSIKYRWRRAWCCGKPAVIGSEGWRMECGGFVEPRAKWQVHTEHAGL